MGRLFKKLTDFVKSFSCGFTIPVINEKFDICKLAGTALSGLISLIKTIFRTIINVFKSIFMAIFNAIIIPIVKSIMSAIKIATTILTKSVSGVYLIFKEVVTAIKAPINIVLEVKFVQYIVIIVDYIIQILLKKLKFIAFLGGAGPTVLIGLTCFIIVFFICVPMIGAFLACFALIKAFVYLILMCDDDDDFMFLLLNIFNYIFGTNYGSKE